MKTSARISGATPERTCVAFQGSQRVATGSITEVAIAARQALDHTPTKNVLIFDAVTAAPIEVDLRGSESDILLRLMPRRDDSDSPTASPARRGRGRPKLGVVAHEVTLLPRHWEWLKSQPGGASVTLRKLVEHARRSHSTRSDLRNAQEASYRFMVAMAGNEHGFEEATRALFAGDAPAFAVHTSSWPSDIQDQARQLANRAFQIEASSSPSAD